MGRIILDKRFKSFEISRVTRPVALTFTAHIEWKGSTLLESIAGPGSKAVIATASLQVA